MKTMKRVAERIKRAVKRKLKKIFGRKSKGKGSR